MKKINLLTNALAALMLLLALAGALCGAVVQQAQNPLLYGSQSREAVMDSMGFESEDEVTAYIGLDWQAQDDLAGRIALTMRLEQGEFNVEELNAKERQHMGDVRELIRLAQRVSQGCMALAAALAVVTAWTGARDGRRFGLLPGVLAGLLLAVLSALIICALMNTQGFERMFVGMHHLLFTNDLWLLDPRTDILIRMMPQLLFERAALQAVDSAIRAFGITCAMLLAAHALVRGMIKRRLSNQNEESV